MSVVPELETFGYWLGKRVGDQGETTRTGPLKTSEQGGVLLEGPLFPTLSSLPNTMSGLWK